MSEFMTGSLDTPWGRVTCEIGPAGVREVIFDGPPAPPLTGMWGDALAGYLRGEHIPADLPIDISGFSEFSTRVLAACRAIPFGQVLTYGELARIAGYPRAARAVGQVMARNPLPLVIPCHRVVGRGGKLTGFSGGMGWKRALLRHEGYEVSENALVRQKGDASCPVW